MKPLRDEAKRNRHNIIKCEFAFALRDETFDGEAMPDGIQDALLIYNPTSGRRQHRRFAEIEQAVRILKDAGIRTELAPTTPPMRDTGIARQAVQQGRGRGVAGGGGGTKNRSVKGL